MGYYANYSGSIKLKELPPEDIIKEFENYFENFDLDETYICFGGYEKYYEDSVEELLDKIKQYTESGSIEYTGDDNCNWRFIFNGGEWDEESGEIVYGPYVSNNMQDEFLGQIIDIFDDEIDPEKPVFTGEKYDHVAEKLKTLMRGWRIF